MWLINVHTYELESFEGNDQPPYAILSHKWEAEEVSFKDFRKQRYAGMRGWEKIEQCCKQALHENDLSYVWVDTCCIDKRSSSELSEAVNSMYRWYEEAKVCYVYLSDIIYNDGEPDNFTTSVWFTRGWTLQELLAPNTLFFFDSQWRKIGSKSDLGVSIAKRTRIAQWALSFFDPRHYSIAQKMAWAAGRQTTRIEDRAYSLLGIFDVNLPLLYGEGEKAFTRLQEEIMRVSNDTSIFAWSSYADPYFAMLARTPDAFSEHAVRLSGPWRDDFVVSKAGISATFHLWHYVFNIYLVVLGNDGSENKQGFDQTFTQKDDQQRSCIGIFLQHNHQDDRFQRVILDDQYALFATLGPNSAHLHQLRHVNIARASIRHVSSSWIPMKSIWSGSAETEARIRSALIFASSASNGSHSPNLYGVHQPLLTSNHALRLSKISFTYKESRGCICIARPGSTVLTSIIHFDFNIHGLPVVLISKIAFMSRALHPRPSTPSHACCDGHALCLSFESYLSNVESTPTISEWPLGESRHQYPGARSRRPKLSQVKRRDIAAGPYIFTAGFVPEHRRIHAIQDWEAAYRCLL